MPEYLNNSASTVYLTGPDNKLVTLRRGERSTLSEYFDVYVKRGYILKIEGGVPPEVVIKNRRGPTMQTPTIKPQAVTPNKFKTARGNIQAPKRIVTVNQHQNTQPDRTVGTQTSTSATLLVNKANSQHGGYPINNGIGIGILSYNRLESLKRCVDSILKYVDLSNTNVFISDDNSDDTNLLQYLAMLDQRITILTNSVRAGIAGNSNRLLQCLSRFKHKFLLNDDVEILNGAVFKHYIDTAGKASIHHLMKHQVGVYGGKPGTLTTINFTPLIKVDKKPQGAFLYLDDCIYNTVGYFDERFGLYGQEHIDFSNRVIRSGIQPIGYFDVPDSDNFVKIYSDKSAVDNKAELLKQSKTIVSSDKTYVDSRFKTDVPCITLVVPFRNHNRDDCLPIVINNLIGQSFPDLKIIVVEHDVNPIRVGPGSDNVKYLFVPSNGGPFNKSKAFNYAVKTIDTEKLILHDADTLAVATYVQNVFNILDSHDSCHICDNISYTSRATTRSIVEARSVPQQVSADRVVAYFEGGSIGMKKSAYVAVGGFHEGFEGYGCFCPNNYVLTNSGDKLIQDVTESDLVYTYTKQYQKVVLRQRNYMGKVLDIFVPGRLPIKGVTPEHPFLVEVSLTDMMWVKACDLKLGTKIAMIGYTIESCFNDETKFGEVSDIKESDYSGPVYNFEVENDKSYVVNGYCVHNCEDCDFYARISKATKFYGERNLPLLHLWHDRPDGWELQHAKNIILEKELKSKTLAQRIAIQQTYIQ